MNTKNTWLLVSCLMVLSLLIASCAPKTTANPNSPTTPATSTITTSTGIQAGETKTTNPAISAGAEMVKLNLKKFDGTTVEKLVEKPKYGGTLRLFRTTVINSFDPGIKEKIYAPLAALTMNGLKQGDWIRSAAGTGEDKFWTTTYTPQRNLVPALAESWEIPDANTIIYHIRKGVKFHDKPPRGTWSGREMTADDVVFSINREYAEKQTFVHQMYLPETYPVSVEATDKYTVVVKSASNSHIMRTHEGIGHIYIYARDFIEKYKDMTDWHNEMGTGPFILVDYVPASISILERNPNYWEKDPLFPENTLPYIDKIEEFVIPDQSTYIAALRTGKIDTGQINSYDDFDGLQKTRPDLQYIIKPNYTPKALTPKGVMDPNSIYSDIRIRRALSMAINREAIIKDFYSGYGGVMPNWPILGLLPDWKDIYIPLQELPNQVREDFSYNPEKAKQLLADAGYPKGFKTSIDIVSADVKILTVIQEYWRAINVDLELKTHDYPVWVSIRVKHNQQDFLFDGLGSTNLMFQAVTPGGSSNHGGVNDPHLNDLISEVGNLIYDEPAQFRLVKEKVLPYILEQSWYIQVPNPDLFIVWQPWLKNYNGENSIGLLRGNSFAVYIWLDQELKKKMKY